MERTEHRFSLDVQKTVATTTIALKKGETAHRLLITLSEEGMPYHIGEDCTAVFSAVKPDGKTLFQECTIVDNVIIYDIEEQTTAAVGAVNCEIQLYGGNALLLISATFRLVVWQGVDNRDDVESSEEFSALVRMITQAVNATNAANDAAGDIREALENGEFQGKDYVLTEADKEEIARMAAELVPGGGGVDEEQLTQAVEAALAQAKESGEFDGEDGYTPVKGKDYFTEADKSEMVQAVGEQIEIPKVPNSLPANGGNADTVDGKHAGDFASSGHTHNYSDLRGKPTIPTVPAWAQSENKPAYTAGEVGADAAGTAAGKVSEHNASGQAHGDIRLLIQGLTDRLNALADSDDTTLDQMSELVAYIKSNKSLIDGITTGKVSVSDIVDNLTTSVANKPLSAKQGVALKALIDKIVVPTKVSQLTNDSGYLTAAPVTSVNGKKGAVVLSASDVGALPNTTVIPVIPDSLPANGGNADTVGGKTAEEIQRAAVDAVQSYVETAILGGAW